MENYNEIREIMQSLGFTKYEIVIMVKLYENGPSKADELKDNNISLSRVYDALEMLRRKKFIKVSQGRPRIYVAIKPQNAVHSLIEQERIKQDEKINVYSKLAISFLDHAQALYYNSHTEISPDDLMIQISTLKEAEEKTRSIIKSAQSSITIFTHIFNWFNEVKDDLKEAINRGCEVRVLLQGENTQDLLLDLKELGVTVKVLDEIKMYTRGTIVDNQSVLFIIWVKTDNQSNTKIYRPQYSTNRGIVEVFNNSFNYLWH